MSKREKLETRVVGELKPDGWNDALVNDYN